MIKAQLSTTGQRLMRFFRRKIKNPVAGTAEIIRCSAPRTNRAVFATCTMFIVVDGPGITRTSHELNQQVRVSSWPTPGMVLPCTIDANHQDRFEIDFGAIPDWQDEARNEAARAAQFGGQAHGIPAGAGFSGSTGVARPVTVVGAGSPEQASAAIRQAERALGVDLDGDGAVG